MRTLRSLAAVIIAAALTIGLSSCDDQNTGRFAFTIKRLKNGYQLGITGCGYKGNKKNRWTGVYYVKSLGLWYDNISWAAGGGL